MVLDDILLPLIVLLIFIIFIGWMLYLLIASRFQTTYTAASVPFLCPVNQCATNIQSGFKTCPVGNELIPYDPVNEVCNSRYLCTSTITPYALQPDGSTDIYGVCPTNVECPCVRINTCPSYITTIFSSTGNPYQSLTGQRITFPQKSSAPPITYTLGQQFCTIPSAWLPLTNPGCNFISATQGMSYDNLVTCMGMINGCSGIGPGSPCLQGTLALITNNPDTVTTKNLYTYQYGCVTSTPCECGQLAIFDTDFGNIVCRTLT
jgi:hypothetical protein